MGWCPAQWFLDDQNASHNAALSSHDLWHHQYHHGDMDWCPAQWFLGAVQLGDRSNEMEGVLRRRLFLEKQKELSLIIISLFSP